MILQIVYIYKYIYIYIDWLVFSWLFRCVCCCFSDSTLSLALYHSLSVSIPTPPLYLYLSHSLTVSLTNCASCVCVYRSVYIYAAVQKSVQKICLRCFALFFLLLFSFSLAYKIYSPIQCLKFWVLGFLCFFLLFLSYEPKMFKYNNAEIYNFVVGVF